MAKEHWPVLGGVSTALCWDVATRKRVCFQLKAVQRVAPLHDESTVLCCQASALAALPPECRMPSVHPNLGCFNSCQRQAYRLFGTALPGL